MISLFLLIFIVVFITIIVEIAATSLKLTGLDLNTARFQALSAITGTGFTTKETELIMGHRQRRGIIMTLMIVGPICFIGIVSSLLISLKEKIIISHLLTMLLVVALLLLITRSSRFMAFFHRKVENQLRRYKYPRRVQLEEILQLSGEYGVYEFKVLPESRFVNKCFTETNFKDKGCIVLAIERGQDLISIPKGNDIILAEDVLVIFGQLDRMKELVEG